MQKTIATTMLTKQFENDFLFLKTVFILLLLTMSLMTHYTIYMKQNPWKFLFETFFYGVMGALPFIYFERIRKTSNHHFLYVFGMLFSLYVVFHILLELSGTYSYLYEISESGHNTNSTKTAADYWKQGLKDMIVNNSGYSSLIVLFAILAYFAFRMIYISYKVGDFHIRAYHNNTNQWTWFIIEVVLFAFCNSFPFLIFAYDRRSNQQEPESSFDISKNVFEISILFVKFAILHIMLQASGFYHHTFGY